MRKRVNDFRWKDTAFYFLFIWQLAQQVRASQNPGFDLNHVPFSSSPNPTYLQDNGSFWGAESELLSGEKSLGKFKKMQWTTMMRCCCSAWSLGRGLLGFPPPERSKNSGSGHANEEQKKLRVDILDAWLIISVTSVLHGEFAKRPKWKKRHSWFETLPYISTGPEKQETHVFIARFLFTKVCDITLAFYKLSIITCWWL